MGETRAFLIRGNRAHLIRRPDPAGGGVGLEKCVRCGTRPRPWERWYGFEDAEKVRVDQMRLCVQTITKGRK